MIDERDSKPWYTDWFGRDYIAVYAHRDIKEAVRQIDFVESVIRPTRGARVLDLCCGSGRHSIELTKRGFRVCGVDLSAELLDRARKDAECANTQISFVRSDMRCAVGDHSFDLVVNFFTSFGYFETDVENRRVLDAIYASLRPGGGWLVDYINREYVIANLVSSDEHRVNGLHIRQQRRIDTVRGRVEKTLTVTDGESSRMYRESVRMYSYPELRTMFADAGLKINAVFGDFDGRPFGTSSPRLILTGSVA